MRATHAYIAAAWTHGCRHDNIIAVRDVMRPASKDSFNDVYIVS